MAISPTLADVILAAMDSRLATVFTALPGYVVDYDPSDQSVAVQPAVKQPYQDETGSRIIETLPVLPRIPAIFLGGGDYRTIYPLELGDPCLVLFTSCALDRWLTSGDSVVDPVDERRHDINDAVALVGLRRFVVGPGGPRVSAPTDHMSVGADSGASVEIYPDEVRVGGDDATQAVVVQSALDTLYNAITSAIALAAPGGASPDPTANDVLGRLKAAIDTLGGLNAGTIVAKAK